MARQFVTQYSVLKRGWTRLDFAAGMLCSSGELRVTTFWTFSATTRGGYHWGVAPPRCWPDGTVGIIGGMTKPARIQRTYDHRLRDLFQSTGNIRTAVDLGVPESTARGWLRSAAGEVVSCCATSDGVEELQRTIAILRERNERLVATLRMVVVLLKVSGFTLNRRRVAEAWKKALLLRAIERSRGVLGLRSCLRLLRLSSSRFHSWRRESECELDDVSSCPRTNPRQLTRDEVREIKEMVTAEEFRHVPTGALAVLAQRLGTVFASASTWHRLVRRHGWRRPRARVHPDKPTIGIRAAQPNEIWHVDATVIRLIDGSKVYLHAVIDNFSRRILSWKVSDRLQPANTVAILLEAAKHVDPSEGSPSLLVDGGSENFNSEVDEFIKNGTLQRLLAMTDVMFSNSMIESWFRAIKHQWLFMNTLDSVSRVEKLVEFYVAEHNGRIPHSAFQGQTPEEVYFGTGGRIPDDLEAARVTSRQIRLEKNRAVSCSACA